MSNWSFRKLWEIKVFTLLFFFREISYYKSIIVSRNNSLKTKTKKNMNRKTDNNVSANLYFYYISA